MLEGFKLLYMFLILVYVCVLMLLERSVRVQELVSEIQEYQEELEQLEKEVNVWVGGWVVGWLGGCVCMYAVDG